MTNYVFHFHILGYPRYIRSSYFQQIEEDVQKYSKQITKLIPAIANFKSKDMTVVLKFHRDVESVLEHLTDESQASSKNSCHYIFC